MAAITYSISYNLAMHKFNKVVSYNYEKQQMYSKLSEVDNAIRQEYFEDLNEENLIDGICNGYFSGLNDGNCKYFSGDEYKEYMLRQNQIQEAVKFDRIDDVGYLRVFSINGDFYSLLVNSFQSMQSDNIHKFIIDFRGAIGENNDQLGKAINFLLPEETVVSYVDRYGTKEIEFKSTSPGVNDDIVIICNKNTVGLSEVLISTMRDYGNVKIVGEKTAGRALKMKTLQLSDGSVVMFPTAYYVSKNERSLYKDGVVPDVEVSLGETESELFKNNKLDYSDDAQLIKALDLLS